MKPTDNHTIRIITLVGVVTTLAALGAGAGQVGPAAPASGEPVPLSVWAPATTSHLDSAAHRHWLLTNLTTWVLARPGNPVGYVPTNTVALREYTLEFLLKLANEVNEKWDLGLPRPVTADHVTDMSALPLTNEVSISIRVLGRFGFRFSEGRFAAYADHEYWMNAYEGKPEKLLQRAYEKDLLNKKSAKQIAIRALNALGYDEQRLQLAAPEMFQEPGPKGTKGFPYYQIFWRPKGKRGPSWRKPVVIGVSGHTGKVCFYENTSPLVPRTPLPTNYWALLGMKPPPGAPPATEPQAPK